MANVHSRNSKITLRDNGGDAVAIIVSKVARFKIVMVIHISNIFFSLSLTLSLSYTHIHIFIFYIQQEVPFHCVQVYFILKIHKLNSVSLL